MHEVRKEIVLKRKLRQSFFSIVVILFISLLGFGLIFRFQPTSSSKFLLVVDGKIFKDDRLVFHEENEKHILTIINKTTKTIYENKVNYAFSKNGVLSLTEHNENYSQVTLERVGLSVNDFALDIIDTKGQFRFTITISILVYYVVVMDFGDVIFYQ